MIGAFQRPTQKYYVGIIKEALRVGQRPTAAILHDPYALHRNATDPWWEPDPVRDTQWTHWDYALMEAVSVLDSLIDGNTGQPRWLVEDPEVDWKLGSTVNFGEQILAKANEKLKPDDGIRHYLHSPYKKGEFWTIEEWLQNIEDEEKVMERGAPHGGHAPTAAENIARKKAQQDRIDAAMRLAESP